MPLPAVLGMVAGQALNTGMGMLQSRINDQRQLQQNKKLMEQQTQAGKDMARFNKQMSLDMWEATGYEAQRKQMEAAGINPALMYGSAGSGGTTQGASADMPSSSAAPAGGGEIGMGMIQGMQMQMMQAQKDNVQADTKLKDTQADKLKGVDTDSTKADTDLTLQKTESEKLNTAILGIQEGIEQVNLRVKQGTEDDAVKAVGNVVKEGIEKVRAARADANVKEATVDETIKQIKQQGAIKALEIAAMKKGLIKMDAETASINQGIKKMIAEIGGISTENLQRWNSMSNADKEIKIKQIMQEIGKQNADFNTSTPQQIGQWVELVGDILTLGVLKW